MTKTKHILIAEDDPDIGNMVRLHLSEKGWQVQWATTGKRARELLGGSREAIRDALVS